MNYPLPTKFQCLPPSLNTEKITLSFQVSWIISFLGSAGRFQTEKWERIRIFNATIGFYDKNTTVHSIKAVVNKYLPSNYIDFLTLDIEGAEYRVLPDLEKKEWLLQGDIIICQMDVELHLPTFHQVLAPLNENFTHFWRKFITSSPFMPIRATSVFNLHNKVTFLNYASPWCLKKLSLTYSTLLKYHEAWSLW